MCGRLCLSARLRSYVTETVAQTTLGTFKLSPFTCLSVSNLQQMRTESAHCLQFIFRSCHLFVEGSGWVWGGWGLKEAPLSYAQQAADVNLNHNIDLLSFYVCGGNFTHGYMFPNWESQEYRSAFSDFNMPPPKLLTTTAPRHPFHTNLTRTHVPHAYSYTRACTTYLCHNASICTH